MQRFELIVTLSGTSVFLDHVPAGFTSGDPTGVNSLERKIRDMFYHVLYNTLRRTGRLQKIVLLKTFLPMEV